MRIVYEDLEFIDLKLRDLMEWVEDKTGLEFTITSLYRIGDSGVHGTLPVRGVDLRMRSALIGEMIAGLVNAHWIYDPDRLGKECAIYHDVGQGAHLHLQVHPNTKVA